MLKLGWNGDVECAYVGNLDVAMYILAGLAVGARIPLTRIQPRRGVEIVNEDDVSL